MGSLLRPLLLAAFCAFLPSVADNLNRLHGITSRKLFAKPRRHEAFSAPASNSGVV